jgi:ABC-type glycerol-3-phosphate transport system substrate-binding protein
VTTLNAWLLSRGTGLLTESNQQATFNSPSGVESLALVRRLMDSGLAWRPDEPYGDYVAFANGQAAFTFSSTGNSLYYVDAYEGALSRDVPAFDWRQTMIPQVDPTNPATVLYGASFFIPRGDPGRELAAWRLIRWLTDTNQTALWASGLQSMPIRASALTVMTDTLEAYPFIRFQAEELMPYGQPEPAYPQALEIRDILYTAIVSVTQGYADPQTVLNQAAEDANQVLSGGQ